MILLPHISKRYAYLESIRTNQGSRNPGARKFNKRNYAQVQFTFEGVLCSCKFQWIININNILYLHIYVMHILSETNGAKECHRANMTWQLSITLTYYQDSARFGYKTIPTHCCCELTKLCRHLSFEEDTLAPWLDSKGVESKNFHRHS